MNSDMQTEVKNLKLSDVVNLRKNRYVRSILKYVKSGFIFFNKVPIAQSVTLYLEPLKVEGS